MPAHLRIKGAARTDPSTRSRIRLAAGVLLVAALTAACGGSDTPDAGAAPTSEPIQVATSAPAPPGTAAPTTTATSTTTPSAAPQPPAPQLRRSAGDAVLTENELPGAGWKSESNGNPEATDQPSERPECTRQSTPLRAGLIDSAEAGWYLPADPDTESIQSQVFIYGDVAAAQTAINGYGTLASSCTQWNSGHGTSYGFHQRQTASAAPIGDEAAVVRQVTVFAPELPNSPTITSYSVASRVANSIAVTTFTPSRLMADGPGLAPTIALAEKATAKLKP